MTAWVILGALSGAIGCIAFVMFSFTALSIVFNAVSAALDNAPAVLAIGFLLLCLPRLVRALKRWYAQRPLAYRF